jgi:hypothetical protein
VTRKREPQIEKVSMHDGSIWEIDHSKLSRSTSKTGRLQRAVLDQMRTHVAVLGGLPTSIRFLFYELVMLKVISKTPGWCPTRCWRSPEVSQKWGPAQLNEFAA